MNERSLFLKLNNWQLQRLWYYFIMSNFHIKDTVSLVLAAIMIVLLNFVIFLGVYSNNPQAFTAIVDSLFASFLIYFLFLVLCIISVVIDKKKIIRYSFYAMLSVMTIHVFYNLYQLILSSNTNQNGSAILFDAFLIWVSSVMTFSIWYWIIDKQSSVGAKIDDERTKFDFLFPQNQTALKMDQHWKPTFFEYVSLSLFTSTSFAPSDTLPMTKRARLLMMIEASISLIIIGMVAARAISLVK